MLRFSKDMNTFAAFILLRKGCICISAVETVIAFSIGFFFIESTNTFELVVFSCEILGKLHLQIFKITG